MTRSIVILVTAVLVGCGASDAPTVAPRPPVPATVLAPTTVSPAGEAPVPPAPVTVATADRVADDPFVQISAGLVTCAVRRSGQVACFTDTDPVLRPIAGLDDAVEVAVTAGQFGCAVRRGGTVRCFDLQPGRKEQIVSEPAITEVTSIVFRAWDLCAVRRSGAPLCFQPFDRTPPAPAHYPKGVVQLATGENHDCALLADGGVHCWGSNGRGQLGRGAPRGTSAADDIVPDGPADGARAEVKQATAVAAASEHSCAIVAGGNVTCWGTHYQGALGVGDVEVPVGKAVSVHGITGAVEIEAYDWTTCVRRADGDAWCWGTNGHGQIGDSTLSDHESPVKLALGGITDLSMSQYRTCATLADGGVACWGSFDRLRPTAVAGLTDAVALTAGLDGTCARRADGTAWCWGRLGSLRGTSSVSIAAPVAIPQLDGLTDVELVTDAWDWKACGISDRGIVCSTLQHRVGSDIHDLAARKRTTVVYEVAGAKDLELDGGMPCVVAAGKVGCYPDADDRSLRIPVPGLDGARAIVSVTGAVCGITATGGVACVGRRGKDHDLAKDLGGKAHPVPGITGAIAIAGVWENKLCALEKAGTIACWEYSHADEKIVYAAPIDGITDAVSIGIGDRYTCAVRKTGAVACFDMPARPEFLEIQPTDDLVTVDGITDTTAIVAGTKHVCALRRGGTVSCWGDNQYGQVGDGTGAGSVWRVPIAP